MTKIRKPYEVSLQGRETSEAFAAFDDARWRADELAAETGREARVYDTRKSIYDRPVYRTGTRSDERF